MADTILKMEDITKIYRMGDEELKALADYAIAESYPHLIGEANIYELFFTDFNGSGWVVLGGKLVCS